MTRQMDRRTVLQLMGATAAAGLAGCSGNQDGNGNGTTTDGPTSTDDGGTTTEGDGQALEVTEVDVDVDGDIALRGALDDELLIVGNSDDGEIVNYAGESDDLFHNVEGDFVPVDDGVAYKAIDQFQDNGTMVREMVLMSGGEELYRKSDGERPRSGDIEIYDSLDGEPLWVDQKDRPGTIMHGEEAIETAYDEVKDVTTIDGEISFIGQEQQDGYTVEDAAVVGDETIEEFDRSAGWLTDIDGEPAYMRSTDNGRVVVFQGQELGGEYTAQKGGTFKDVFELNGSLGFVAEVAPDKMENTGRDQEQALWYDGEEIARHDRIRTPNHTEVGLDMSHVDGNLAYIFTDSQGTDGSDGAVHGGVMYGDELLEPGNDPSLVVGVEGTPAYSLTTEEGDTVVYGDQETDTYGEDAVGQPVEAGGTLYFPADVDGERKIFQVQ